MDTLNKESVTKIAGPLEDELVISIIDTGATPQELADAVGWLTLDEAMVKARHKRPSGVVNELYEILDAARQDEGERPSVTPGAGPG